MAGGRGVFQLQKCFDMQEVVIGPASPKILLTQPKQTNPEFQSAARIHCTLSLAIQRTERTKPKRDGGRQAQVSFTISDKPNVAVGSSSQIIKEQLAFA